MDFHVPLNILLYVVLPPVLGTLGYIARTLMQRINELETKMVEKVTEAEVRQLISDKTSPIQEDLSEIKAVQHEILQILLKNK